MMYPSINTGTLGTSAAAVTEVRLPINHGCTSFSLWTEDGENWQKALASSGADVITVTTPLSLEIPHPPTYTSGGATTGTLLCYALGTVSGQTLVGEITKE